MARYRKWEHLGPSQAREPPALVRVQRLERVPALARVQVQRLARVRVQRLARVRVQRLERVRVQQLERARVQVRQWEQVL